MSLKLLLSNGEFVVSVAEENQPKDRIGVLGGTQVGVSPQLVCRFPQPLLKLAYVTVEQREACLGSRQSPSSSSPTSSYERLYRPRGKGVEAEYPHRYCCEIEIYGEQLEYRLYSR